MCWRLLVGRQTSNKETQQEGAHRARQKRLPKRGMAGGGSPVCACVTAFFDCILRQGRQEASSRQPSWQGKTAAPLKSKLPALGGLIWPSFQAVYKDSLVYCDCVPPGTVTKVSIFFVVRFEAFCSSGCFTDRDSSWGGSIAGSLFPALRSELCARECRYPAEPRLHIICTVRRTCTR